MRVGEALELAPYTVRCALRFDNPAFPKYLIFRGERLIGSQLSRPNLSDCRWHELHAGQYSRKSRGINVTKRPGAHERGGEATARLREPASA